jgi:hypothetical protein
MGLAILAALIASLAGRPKFKACCVILLRALFLIPFVADKVPFTRDGAKAASAPNETLSIGFDKS